MQRALVFTCDESGGDLPGQRVLTWGSPGFDARDRAPMERGGMPATAGAIGNCGKH